MKARREFLNAAEACGAILTGKPDGSESVTVVFSVDAWQKFDQRCADDSSRNLHDAENWRLLRELLGYVEDGSSESVSVSQDDATRSWCVHVGPSHRRRSFYDDSLIGALKKASGL